MNNVNKSKPLPGGIPSVCDALLGRIQEYVQFRPDQLTVTEYKPGQGKLSKELKLRPFCSVT